MIQSIYHNRKRIIDSTVVAITNDTLDSKDKWDLGNMSLFFKTEISEHEIKNIADAIIYFGRIKGNHKGNYFLIQRKHYIEEIASKL